MITITKYNYNITGHAGTPALQGIWTFKKVVYRNGLLGDVFHHYIVVGENRAFFWLTHIKRFIQFSCLTIPVGTIGFALLKMYHTSISLLTITGGFSILSSFCSSSRCSGWGRFLTSFGRGVPAQEMK